ncbi:MAG: sigma-70 family RNA polymerase sigma factor [Dehalococcoidia bacterium]
MDELVARLRRRDASALAELYDSAGGRAFGLAMRVLHDDAAAADVVQEAFTWLWERADRLDPGRGQAAGLLLTIVHRRSIDEARRRQRLQARSRTLEDDELMVDADGAAFEADLEERFRLVRASFGELPPEQRDILAAVYFEGLTHGEVAARSGVALGTVKSRLRLGLEKLRGAIGRAGAVEAGHS